MDGYAWRLWGGARARKGARAQKAAQTQPERAKRSEAGPGRPRRRHRWRTMLIVLAILAVILGVGRAMMPWAVRNYVNRTLDRNPLYSGRIGKVEIHLVRGAYSIDDVRIDKTTGNIPVPLFSARRIDLALQWDALVHGKVVGRVRMEQAQINFVAAPTAGDSQTGAGGPWLQMLEDLFPFRINRVEIRDGSIHFRTYASKKPLDVYMSDLQARIDNLTNIRDETTPLISTVQAQAKVMDQAQFEYKMTFDPFSYQPTFHMAMRLLGLDVTKLNDVALAFGDFDFKRGWFDLVMETDAREGQVRGYIKPLFRDLKVFSLKQDLKEDNVLQFFWQALLGGVTTIFKNQPRNQLGTVIPFTGDVSRGTSPDILATIANLLRNAFIRAYLPRLQSGREEVDGLKFEPPEVSDPNAPGE